MSSALTSGTRHLRGGELAGHFTQHRHTQDQPVETCPLPLLPEPHDAGGDRRRERERDQQKLLADNARDAQDDAGDERQLGVKALVEIREGRHHLQHDDRHENERQRYQDRRIDQRGDRPSPDGRDDLRVLDEAPQHGVEAAAALAGQQRGRVHARKQRAVDGERVRHRRARSHLLVHVVQDAAEGRRRDTPPEQVERLHERHASLQQRRQLLVEHEKLERRDSRLPGQPQPQLAVGRGHTFGDFSAWRREPATELHGSGASTGLADEPRLPARDCQHGHYRLPNYTNFRRPAPERLDRATARKALVGTRFPGGQSRPASLRIRST